MNKDTFCSYPFSSIFLGADAGIKPCCSARYEVGNLNNRSIVEILNSEKFKSIRRSILNETWHDNCSQCKKLESMNARSERSSLNETDYHKWEQLNQQNPLTEDFFNLERIDLRWSNTCNLACNYCYEYFSSQWSTIKGIKVNDVKDENQESLFQLIEKSKDKIENINLLGGEPLLQKQNARLVEILHDKRYYILTNLAVPLKTNKIAEKLLNEKYAAWGVSFETVGDRYEYVRHNASWNTFKDNLKFVKDQRNDITLNAHPLYCTYSAFSLVDYYDFVLSNGFSDVYWCIIQNIEGLNVLNLSKDLKIKAVDEINRCQEKFSEEFRNYDKSAGLDHLIDIKEKLLASLDKESKNKDFISWTNEIENKFLTNKKATFKELWPEIYNDLLK